MVEEERQEQKEQEQLQKTKEETLDQYKDRMPEESDQRKR